MEKGASFLLWTEVCDWALDLWSGGLFTPLRKWVTGKIWLGWCALWGVFLSTFVILCGKCWFMLSMSSATSARVFSCNDLVVLVDLTSPSVSLIYGFANDGKLEKSFVCSSFLAETPLFSLGQLRYTIVSFWCVILWLVSNGWRLIDDWTWFSPLVEHRKIVFLIFHAANLFFPW